MSGKGFFAVSVPVLHRILEQGGDAGDLMAYLVLAKHTTGWGKWKYQTSTAGAKAISKKTGLTYRQAQVRLDLLQKKGFIQPGGAEGTPSHVTSETVHQREATKVRWLLGKLEDDRAYLAHSLIEGIGQGRQHPPLERLWDEVKLGPCTSVKEARADSLLLLIHCYAEQSIRDYGGINPNCLRGNWQEADTPYGLEDMNWLMMELEQPEESHQSASLDFVGKVLPHVPEGDRPNRFWNAFSNLRLLGFMYEVLQVWQDNPLENPRAELFYPLYVLDYHARDSDPYCQRDIHGFLEQCGYLDGHDLYGPEGIIEEAQGGRKTFRILRTEGGRECVIGTYRLRFRPSTEDTGRGMKEEGYRAESWKQTLERAKQERAS